jgi:hypothetical protein
MVSTMNWTRSLDGEEGGAHWMTDRRTKRQNVRQVIILFIFSGNVWSNEVTQFEDLYLYVDVGMM